MSKPDLLVRRACAMVLTYGLACVSVAVALLVTLLLRPDELVSPVFFLAIMLSAGLGGIGPGLLAALLATLAIAYCFLQPLYSLQFDPANVPQLLVFFLSAVLVSSWSAARKRAETLLRRARDEQEAKVQERTADLNQTNETLRSEIAERRRMAETLRERADLLDLTHDTVFVRDMRDVITYWNRGAAERYGWQKEEAVGQVSHDLLRTIFPAPLDEIHAALLGTGRWEGELVHTKRDGTQVVVASRWSLQRDEQGSPVAILETNNDITERRRAEEALRESAKRYRSIFHTAGVSIWEEDFSQVKAAIDELKAQGVRNFRQYLATHPAFVRHAIAMVKIIDVNDATVKLFGAQSKEELLVSLHKVFLPETEDVFAGELLAIAEGRTSFASETVVQSLQRNRLAVLLTMTFPPQPAQLDSVLVSIMDITERKRAEEALQQAQTELAHVTRVTTLGELATSIAHEINQPLAAIVTNGSAGLRWLAGDVAHLDDAREALQCIIDDGQRASAIITRIRALLRKTATEKARLDLPQLVHEVVRLTQHEVVRQGVTLRVEVAADLPPVWGDRVQLQQVLLNLVLNALEALAGVAQGPRHGGHPGASRDSGHGAGGGRRHRGGDCPGAARPDVHGVLQHEGAGAGDGAGDQSHDHRAARGAALGRAARRAGRYRTVYPADGA